MRKFSKKLAFVLAAAMVFTAFAPAASAKAADEMVINKKSQILYVTDGTGMNDAAQVGNGKGNVAQYDFAIKNKVAGCKYNWTSADTSIATVDKVGLTKAVGVGKTTITCTITKDGKEVAAPTVKVEVKRNADSVKITNANTYEGKTVEPNGTVDLNRKMVVDGKEVGRGKYCTDYTRWCAIDPNGNLVKSGEGVTIDQTNGVYTFGEDAVEGDYTLYCETYQSNTYNKGIKTSNKVTVTFEAKNDFTIAQKTSKDFVLTFKKPVATLDLEVVELYDLGGTIHTFLAPHKDPVLSEDKMTATVEFYNDVTNGQVFQFTVDGAKEAKKWTVNVGTVNDIKLTADVNQGTDYRFFTNNTAAELTPSLYDVNGVNITASALAATGAYMEYKEAVASPDGTYSVSTGLDNKASIFAMNENTAVKVLAIYHTGNVDENGNEVTVSKEFTFMSRAAAAEMITGMEYAKLGTSQGTVVTVPLGTTGATLAIKPMISTKPSNQVAEVGYNDTITAGGKTYTVTFEETNNEKLAIDRATGVLYLFQEGTTQVLAKITDLTAPNPVPKAIGVFSVKVTEAVRLDSVSLTQNGIVSVGTIDTLDTATVTVNGKDNYQNPCNTGYTVELEASNTLAKKNYVPVPTVSGNDILIDGSALATAFNELSDAQMNALLTYKVNVKVNGVTKWVKDLSITVKRFNPTNAATSYLLELQPNTGFGDVTRKYTDNTASGQEDYAEAPKTAVYNIYRLKNTIKAEVFTVAPYDAQFTGLTSADAGSFFVRVQKDGKDVAIDGNNIVIDTDATTNAATLTLNFSDTTTDTNGKTVVTYDGMGAGNYVVTLYELRTVGNTDNLVYANVSGGTASGRATVNAGSYRFGSKDSAKADSPDQADIAKCFTIYNKENQKIDWTNGSLDYVVDATFTGASMDSTGSTSVFVKTITFYEAVDTNVFVPYVVTINSSVKVN